MTANDYPIKITRDGFEFEIRLETDNITRPTDFDCYDEKTIDAWKNYEWQYVCLIVSAKRCGFDVGNHLASIWGLEYELRDDDGWQECHKDLINEALHAAGEEWQHLKNRMNAALANA